MSETNSKPKPKYLPPQIWIPAFTAAICLAVLFVLWGLNREAPRQTSPSTSIGTTDDTANWKTYRNEEYGFEVKYPSNWEAKKNDFDRDGDLENDIDLIETSATSIQFGEVFIQAIRNRLNEDLVAIARSSREGKERIFGSYFSSEKFDPDKRFNISGEDAIQVRLVIPKTPNTVAGLIKNTFILHNNFIFSITSPNGVSDIRRIEKQYDQILSTFKFTK